MNKLFVYGSLGLGGPNEHVLKDIGGEFSSGYVMGKLYQEGWGAKMGYPGIRLDEKEEKIEGYLFESDQLENHWNKLDDFEGEAYQRVKVTVTLHKNNKVEEAFIYTLK